MRVPSPSWRGLALLWLASCSEPDGKPPHDSDAPPDSADSHVAEEVCNGRDDDGDGEVDEGDAAPTPWYLDADGDGFGAGVATLACEQPPGTAARGDDCDDADVAVHPGATESCDGADQDCDGVVDDGLPASMWLDADGDGFGDPGAPGEPCGGGDGYVANWADCDDADPDAWPGADERCDAVDQDCDRITDDFPIDELTAYADHDGDGFGATAIAVTTCSVPLGYVLTPGDCDDLSATTWPGAAETCDGTDEDCDGLVDEDFVSTGTWYPDTDGDGFGDASGPITACVAPPGAVVDGTDCDDSNPSAWPGAPEVCDFAADDCDHVDTWTDAVEAGTASWDDGSGAAYVDVTASLAAGTSADPVDWQADADGTLRLCEGTWYARIAVVGHSLRVVGAGMDRTVVDAAHAGRVIQARHAVVEVEGVTLTGGEVSHAAALNARYATATLRRVRVRNNTSYEGCAIESIYGATLTIEASEIYDNPSIDGASCAVGATYPEVFVTDTSVHDVDGYAFYVTSSPGFWLDGSTIQDTYGGVYLSHAPGWISNSEIADCNGALIYFSWGDELLVDQCYLHDGLSAYGILIGNNNNVHIRSSELARLTTPGAWSPIDVIPGSLLTLEDSVVRENTGAEAAVYLDYTDARFIRTDFVDNAPADVWLKGKSYSFGEDASGLCLSDLGCAAY